MNQIECELRIAQKLSEIWDIYKSYNDKGKYLSLCVLEDDVSTTLQFWNSQQAEEDKEKPITYFGSLVTDSDEVEEND